MKISEGTALAIETNGATALVRTNEGLSVVPTGVGRPTKLDSRGLGDIDWAGWHPDGRLIVESGRRSGIPGVWAVTLPSGAPVALLPGGFGLWGHNLIAPDGARLAAVNAQGQLVACVLATSACQPVPGAREGEVVSGWTADNTSLFLYDGRHVPVQVDRLDVGTGRRTAWRTITPRQAAVTGLRAVIAAPDGTLVYAYARYRTQLYVIRGLR
ncbi:MAG: hypothetical protein ACT4QD_11845 [Acidobacteriota bacterium]